MINLLEVVQLGRSRVVKVIINFRERNTEIHIDEGNEWAREGKLGMIVENNSEL